MSIMSPVVCHLIKNNMLLIVKKKWRISRTAENNGWLKRQQKISTDHEQAQGETRPVAVHTPFNTL